ncbi:MAG TPA: recombinase family protein [Candidatus Sulfotelmatobacter sp.]|nr:recombinase family protein [Candidatus Sulfotelmatobacter sp.]
MDQGEEEVIDFTKLRYALYLRKSTDDKERQQRSIDDQQAECEEMAAKYGWHLVKPYYEDHGSAKVPRNPKRGRFYDLLKDLEAGKVDGIIAWHPDRLARNMEDGGEIFGLLDRKVLKDLKFVTHYYTNDATGKMLLGISFTLSTYYSANLSQNVKRGHRRALGEAKSSGAPKHGYNRSEQGIYEPNENYEIVKEAWQMRLRGHSLREISDWMNENGYARVIKDKKSKKFNQIIKMSFQTVGEMFKDSFYCGLMVQTNKTVDLREAYNFEPVVNEDEYDEVQRLSRATASPLIKNRRKTFYPLRGMVKCALCGRNMSPGASKGQHGDRKRYLYYRCINAECTRKKKSIRGKVIFNFIYDLLKDGVNLTDKDYKDYYEHLTNEANKDATTIQTELNSKRGALKATNKRIKNIGLKLIDYSQDSPVWKVNNDELIKLEKDAKDLKKQIVELKENQTDPKKDILSIEQFLNLAKKAGSKVKAANEVGKDHICRIIFLNLMVDEQEVTDYHLTKAFSKLEKMQNVGDGRGERT